MSQSKRRLRVVEDISEQGVIWYKVQAWQPYFEGWDTISSYLDESHAMENYRKLISYTGPRVIAGG